MIRILADVRLALRSWRKAPTLTAIVIASIALGIGANTAIFTLVDQVLLRPLPIRDPGSVVQVTKTGINYGSNWGDGSELSYPMYEHLRDHAQVFDGLAARFGFAVHIRYGGDAGDRTERVQAELVSGTYFQTLGIGPALGRTLLPDDDRAPGAAPFVVLSHSFWTRGFAADAGVVGQPVTINGHPYTIAGVARAGFGGSDLGSPAQVFVPIVMKAQVTPGWDALDDPRFNWVRVFGRLKPGISADQATVALQPLYRTQLQHEIALPGFANAPERTRLRYLENEIRLLPGGQGRSGFRRALATPLWVLMAIAGGVLLIACANVANLLLARAAGRQREMAIRLALGATRGRLVMQLLVESLLLAVAGGAAGIAIAVAGAPLVLSFFVSPESPQIVSTVPDARILAFTFALAALTGIIFGLAPAVQSTKPDVTPALKDQAGSVLGGRQARFRKGLVAVQVAVSLLLLVGAGLFLRTLDNLLAVDVGFRTESLITFTLNPSLSGQSPERTRQFSRELLERLNRMPGGEAAGLGTQRLLDGNQWNGSITAEGYVPQADENVAAWHSAVSPGYFRALGISVVRGREFTDLDARDAAIPIDEQQFRVAIANETFVRRYFEGREAVGRRIGLGSDPGTPLNVEIVGVVGDSKYTGVRDDVQPQIFFPYLEQRTPGGFTAYVRTTQPPEQMFGAVRAAVQALDPSLPVHTTRTLERQIQQSISNERMIATMSATFGILATLLALVGLYGVMSYTVSRRTREIGVRIALGAQRGNIAGMVVREALLIAAVGIAVGLPLAWWLSRYVESQLYGVTGHDLPTLAASAAALAIVSLLAAWIPSARAARVAPTTALRCE
ncbi:MAG: ABC transporter permease [Acidobacteria bacterium]|nr:ABC transporter permease [Acidobacteriota bacterium]